MLNVDYSGPIKEALLRGELGRQKTTNAAKVQAAIAWLGRRYLYHPANRVKRLQEPLADVFAWKPSRVLRRAK